MSWDDWKWSKLNGGWPAPFNPLPTRDGAEKNQSQERRMIEAVGGQDGIRTRVAADGTRLKTRGGFPEFVKDPVTLEEDVSIRGFTFSVGAEASGDVFNCYTITDLGDTPLVRLGYTVAPFKSNTKTVAPEWASFNDVWLYRGNSIYVNGLPNSQIKIGGLSPESRPLPFVIGKTNPWFYGLPNEQVPGFAIGRYSVILPDGVTQTLAPTLPRTQRKALALGQKLDQTAKEARQAQLYYTGSAWDDSVGGWEISMARYVFSTAAPYSTQSASTLTVLWPETTLGVGVSSAISETSPGAAVNAPVALSGHFGATWISGYFPGTETEAERSSKALPDGVEYGDVQWNYSRGGTQVDYLGSASGSRDYCGDAVDLSSEVTYRTRQVTESGVCPAQSYQIAPNFKNPDAYYRDAPPANGGPLLRRSSVSPEQYGPAQTYCYVTPTSPLHVSSSSATRNEKEYSGSFSVSFRGHLLMAGDFYRFDESGERIACSESPSAYPGLAQYIGTEAYTATTQVGNLNLLSAEYQALNVPLIEEFVGQKVYFGGAGFNLNRVGFSVQNLGTVPTISSLNWTTTDFILVDDDNDLKIYLVATYSGANGAGELSVDLRIEGGGGSAQINLMTRSVEFSLPLHVSAPYHVPVPRLSAFPGAYYHHQGAMCGAAYIEESEAADLACLLSFRLRLAGFGDVGASQPSDHGQLNFIPSNLLEMLYAYVYSAWYGLKSDERYPVTRTALYEEFQSTLFGTTWNISYRDGALSSWESPLDGSNSAHFDLGRL